jgi:hypothetical protein
MNLVGALSYPSEYEGFCPVTRGRFSIGSMQDLLNPDLGERTCMPFIRYFNDFIKRDPAFAATDLFGVSIVYDHQLCHAFSTGPHAAKNLAVQAHCLWRHSDQPTLQVHAKQGANEGSLHFVRCDCDWRRRNRDLSCGYSSMPWKSNHCNVARVIVSSTLSNR